MGKIPLVQFQKLVDRIPSLGGVRGVMVIVIGNGHGDKSSNHGAG